MHASSLIKTDTRLSASPGFSDLSHEHGPTIKSGTTVRGAVAEGADRESIRRLAADPDGELLEGLVLFAEVDGVPVAAIGIADGRMVSDPQRATVAVRIRLRCEWLYVRLVHTVWGM